MTDGLNWNDEISQSFEFSFILPHSKISYVSYWLICCSNNWLKQSNDYFLNFWSRTIEKFNIIK